MKEKSSLPTRQNILSRARQKANQQGKLEQKKENVEHEKKVRKIDERGDSRPSTVEHKPTKKTVRIDSGKINNALRFSFLKSQLCNNIILLPMRCQKMMTEKEKFPNKKHGHSKSQQICPCTQRDPTPDSGRIQERVK